MSMLQRLPSMLTVKDKVLSLPLPIRLLSAGLLSMITLLLILRGCFSGSQSSNDFKNLSERLSQLEKIITQQAGQIGELKLLVNDQIPKFNQQLNDVRITLTHLKEQPADTHEVVQAVSSVSSTTQQLSNNLNNLQSEVNQINDRLKRGIEPHYLPASVLPFKVEGIDVWNGTSKVTVRLRGQYTLLNINDALAGWTLINVSTEEAVAVFKSNKGQFVKVSL